MGARKIFSLLSLFGVASLAGCTTVLKSQENFGAKEAASPAADTASAEPTWPVVQATEVRDQAALERLRGNAGLTLQWIGWDKRGNLEVSQRGAVVHIKGSQIGPEGIGRLEIEGNVLSIDSNSFILRGEIRIVGTPDAKRSCIKQSDSEFAITQNRQYWRMREFEWCDDLTDYIDIYF